MERHLSRQRRRRNGIVPQVHAVTLAHGVLFCNERLSSISGHVTPSDVFRHNGSPPRLNFLNSVIGSLRTHIEKETTARARVLLPVRLAIGLQFVLIQAHSTTQQLFGSFEGLNIILFFVSAQSWTSLSEHTSTPCERSSNITRCVRLGALYWYRHYCSSCTLCPSRHRCKST